VIARVLSNAEDHPDAEELYRRAAALDPHISIATVYRTVKLFEDAGILERHDFRDGRFALRGGSGLASRPSNRCTIRTGHRIPQMKRSSACSGASPRKLGFELIDHRLELYGVPKGARKRGH